MQTKKLFELILSIILCIVSPMTFCQNENSIENTIINNIVRLPLYWPELEFTDDDREPDGAISEETYSRKMIEWWNGSIDHDYLAFYSPDENKQELSVRGLKAEDFLTNENYFVFIEIKNVIIPDEINGFPVVSIDEEAFCNGESGDNIDKVERIVVGKSITEIKDVAFGGRQELVIGKNPVDDFSPYALSGVSKLYCYSDSPIYSAVINGKFSYKPKIILIDESHLTSNVATIDEELNVRGLPSGLTKETVKDYVSVDGDAIMEISDDVITTGTTIELVNREYGTIDNTYTVIIDGDINGDGATGAAEDFTAMREIITGSDSEYSEINKQAADLNGDGIVNSTDLTIMKSLLN